MSKTKTKKRKTAWVKVGEIGVDAGLCWVGDPCYILHKDGHKRPVDIGKDWREFCDKMSEDDYSHARQFNYDLGHAGLGVCVSTGMGDGVYNVEARIEEVRGWGKRVREIRIKFC